MRFLLSRNADPTRTDINGRYPLHLAAGAGWHSIVKKLALLPQFQYVTLGQIFVVTCFDVRHLEASLEC